MQYFRLIICLILVFSVELAGAQKVRKFHFGETVKKENYDPTTIIVKIKPSTNDPFAAPKDDKTAPQDQPRSRSIIKAEPISATFRKSANTRVKQSPFLNGVYKITLEPGSDIEAEINKLLKYENVIYAEPLYQEQLLVVPDDPLANPTSGSQAHLGVIRAYEAWDIQQGNENISIAVIDTGGDLDHPDLVDNLQVNQGDPINGVDDDNDGLIDNFNGYDFADLDNDPTADQSGHGVLVNGLSSATTNNTIGVAGTSFKSPYVPYKIFKSSNGNSNNTYEAVLFAAQKGHQVLNLSWGSINSFSQFNQDIINTAVLEHDAVIVAAAGNTPEELDFYPASYANVLSVASTNDDDTKSGFSTFSYHVDIAAPGTNNYTTKSGGGYGFTGGGTSYSAPLVAGAAALLRAQFPNWNAQQIMEQLRVSANDVYNLGNNENFFGQLGKGRLDMFTALSDTTFKSIRLSKFDYKAQHDKLVFYSDTVELSTEFQNYLQPTINASVTLSSESEFVTIVNSDITLDSLNTMEVFDQTLPIKILLSEDTPPDEAIRIRLDYTGVDYADWQFVKFNTAPDYLDMGTSVMSLTIAGNGNLGYQEDVKTNGNGFLFEGNSIANQLGIIISSDGIIIDNVVNDFAAETRNHDFSTSKNIKLFANSIADNFGLSFLNDSNAGANEVGLHLEQKVLSWSDTGNENHFIVEYRISNATANNLSDIKLALFADWDIANHLENSIDWDGANKLGYGSGATTFGGMALLTAQNPIFQALDIGSENGNTPDLTNAFLKTDKSTFMSSGTSKTQAGLNGGNDIAQIIGGELGALNSGQSVKIAFAMVTGNSLSELQDATQKASLQYQNFLDNPPLIKIDTTCLGKKAVITLTTGTNYDFYSDARGTNLVHSGNNYETQPLSGITQFYVQNSDSIFKTDLRTVRLIPQNIVPVFHFKDTLFLGDIPNNLIEFSDSTLNATDWLWDFDNGSGSTNQFPTSHFNQAGDFQIKLTVTNKYGCTAEISKMMRVRERGPAPEFNSYQVCFGETVSISSINQKNLRVYANIDDINPIAEGTEFTSSSLSNDTTFYVSNIDPEFESARIEVPVTIIKLEPKLTYQPDSLDLDNKNLIQFTGGGNNLSTFQWTINEITSAENSPVYDFTGVQQIDVTMKVSDDNGCTESISSSITPQVSLKPILTDATICTGDSLKIEPGGGEFFYFYRDSALTQLVHKGKSFLTDPIEKDIVFYVTNVENLLESESESIRVNFFSFEVDFSITPNPLILDKDQTVALNDESDGAISWKWFIDGELVEITRNPVLFFGEEADHEIKLVIENEKGCVSEMTRVLQVRLVAGLDDDQKGIFTIYPNPAKNVINLKMQSIGASPTQFELMDLTGRIIRTGTIENQVHLINIEGVHSGLYVVKVFNKKFSVSKRILIE